MSTGDYVQNCNYNVASVLEMTATVEPRFNEPLYNEFLGLTNDILRPSNGKVYGKEPRYDETSAQRTHFVSTLALRYIDVHCTTVVQCLEGVKLEYFSK